MKARVLNQVDNILTVELEGDRQYKQDEPLEIKSKRKTFRKELQGLYWILLTWVIENKQQYKLPGIWFKRGEGESTALAKLYTLTRFQAEWLEVDYDATGMQRVRARSTSEGRCNQEQISDVYAKTYQYLSDYIDMTGFNNQYEAARERLGKFF